MENTTPEIKELISLLKKKNKLVAMLAPSFPVDFSYPEIIGMLNEGESVRKVEAQLKEKYPNNKKLWLTSVTLQKFRKNHLQLDGKVLKDIQENNKLQQLKIEEEALQRQLEATNAYQDKINAIADTHLDVASKIAQLDSVIGSFPNTDSINVVCYIVSKYDVVHSVVADCNGTIVICY